MATIRLPSLLEAQAALDDVRMVGGQLDRARIAQEVGRVEQVDVERVALDPLAAVEEAAQARGPAGSISTPKRPLEGVDGGHLVGDRADAADARDDVDDLVRRSADDEPLEVARRLEDLEVRLRHLRRRGRVSDSRPSPSTRVSWPTSTVDRPSVVGVHRAPSSVGAPSTTGGRPAVDDSRNGGRPGGEAGEEAVDLDQLAVLARTSHARLAVLACSRGPKQA